MAFANGVWPTLSDVVKSAPFAINIFAASRCPKEHAMCSALKPVRIVAR